MKIEMPLVSKEAPYLPNCTPTLVQHKNSVLTITAIRANEEVLYFNTTGVVLWSSYDYFQEEYRILRTYDEGETLSVTR